MYIPAQVLVVFGTLEWGRITSAECDEGIYPRCFVVRGSSYSHYDQYRMQIKPKRRSSKCLPAPVMMITSSWLNSSGEGSSSFTESYALKVSSNPESSGVWLAVFLKRSANISLYRPRSASTFGTGVSLFRTAIRRLGAITRKLLQGERYASRCLFLHVHTVPIYIISKAPPHPSDFKRYRDNLDFFYQYCQGW